MSVKGGYFFKILEVDLTTGTSGVRPIDENFALQYIGGRGFGARILADHLKKMKRIDPLGPDNILVIAPGPLTGVYLPASGKNSFITISPATGIYGDSSIGGVFGVELRQAGYDAVVLKGRAPVLSALSIQDDMVKVIPMPHAAGSTALGGEACAADHRRLLLTSGLDPIDGWPVHRQVQGDQCPWHRVQHVPSGNHSACRLRRGRGRQTGQHSC